MGEHATAANVRLDEKIEQARALRPLILKHRDESDQERRLAQPVVEALVDLGAFRAVIPQASGGEEWDWLTFMCVVEELSSMDGSVGWTMGVGGGVGGIVSGWLSADAARDVFSSDPIGLTAGAGQRNGRARAVDGGYRLTGRWSFASGAAHASWFMGGYSLDDPAANLAARHRPGDVHAASRCDRPRYVVGGRDARNQQPRLCGGRRFCATAVRGRCREHATAPRWSPLPVAVSAGAGIRTGAVGARDGARSRGLLYRVDGGEGGSARRHSTRRPADRARAARAGRGGDPLGARLPLRGRQRCLGDGLCRPVAVGAAGRDIQAGEHECYAVPAGTPSIWCSTRPAPAGSTRPIR